MMQSHKLVTYLLKGWQPVIFFHVFYCKLHQLLSLLICSSWDLLSSTWHWRFIIVQVIHLGVCITWLLVYIIFGFYSYNAVFQKRLAPSPQLTQSYKFRIYLRYIAIFVYFFSWCWLKVTSNGQHTHRCNILSVTVRPVIKSKWDNSNVASL